MVVADRCRNLERAHCREHLLAAGANLLSCVTAALDLERGPQGLWHQLPDFISRNVAREHKSRLEDWRMIDDTCQELVFIFRLEFRRCGRNLILQRNLARGFLPVEATSLGQKACARRFLVTLRFGVERRLRYLRSRRLGRCRRYRLAENRWGARASKRN